MPSPNATPTPITPPRVPLIDPRTGLIDRAWYLFFLSLQDIATAVVDDGDTGADAISLLASYDAALMSVNQELQTLPSHQVGDLQAQIDEVRQQFATVPRQELGTMAALQQANLPWVTFDTTPEGVPTDIGTVAWDGGTTLGIQMTANVLQQVGETQYYYIKASAAIAKGELVMFDGSVGASGVLKGKPSTGVTNGQLIMGVAAEAIANNGFGLVSSFGLVRGFNTTGTPYGEVWADGDILYYNPSYVGGLTKNLPAAPTPHVVVAAVVNASSAGAGSVFVRVQAEPLISQLSDVYAPTPANNDVLLYDGVQLRWENVPASTIIASVGGAPVTKTADFTVADNETWLINNKSGSTCTVTLPTASAWTGRELTFKNMQAQTLVSASSNVVPIDSTTAGTAILLAVVGNWATMVSDGTNWVIMQQAANNCLLLE